MNVKCKTPTEESQKQETNMYYGKEWSIALERSVTNITGGS